MFTKEFEIRWSDLDANRHLANSAYVSFMSHTRMAFLMQNGLGQRELAKLNLGPVMFYEHIYYFKEVFVGKPIKVSLELKGFSEDGKFFEFAHNFYDAEGKNFARCELMGGWIDMNTRKLTGLPEQLLSKLSLLSKTDNFKLLTSEDTRRFGMVPKHLE